MPYNQQRGGYRKQRWKEKPNHGGGFSGQSPAMEGVSTSATDVTNGFNMMSIGGNNTDCYDQRVQYGRAGISYYDPMYGHNATWKPRPRGTAAYIGHREVQNTVNENDSGSLSSFYGNKASRKNKVDQSTYSVAQIRATFYPKFENEKSDQEVRTRMIEMVSKGLATMEVSLKHSGSLFMYAGHQGGAYAKNSYGNIYTAVGVFVLGQTFREAWGTRTSRKQQEFNEFLERNRMCISMELVTAVLGDHGQRPQEDYVVVTAVTELGKGKPNFYSTPDIIAFCRKWRLPTNHVWLFSTGKSVTSFFAAYDALCEEGTATTLCKALDEIADISVPGSKDHIKVQGEILEGLVARIVSHESSKHLEQVLREFPPPPLDGGVLDVGPSLREICAANRSDEKQQIKALLRSVGTSFCPNYLDWFGDETGSDVQSRNADQSVIKKFLKSHPADFATSKFQEMVRLMREKILPAAFKCFSNLQRIDSVSSDILHFRMVIHVYNDSAFQKYQKEMRHKPGLWPLYRGFFIDINIFKASKEKADEISRNNYYITEDLKDTGVSSRKDGLEDEDANLMVKLKFLTYKLRTYLIRNGLSILCKDGRAAYKNYYLRQMKIWNTSSAKQTQLITMLDEWAIHILEKYGHRQLSASTYLSEAEPFLEQYAKRSPQNQALIGSAGTLVRSEDFLANVERNKNGEVGLIVFFPGIPGCGKSALCKEILNTAGGLGDDRPVHSLMGDLIKGKYWQKFLAERKKRPYSVMLADKNAPNEKVWRKIEDMCLTTKSSAVPVVPDSEGTETNPFSIDVLAVCIFRVLHRVNHPGKLDKACPNAGYVLLKFYHLYKGKSRIKFEAELIGRYGSLVKIPLLKSDRNALPDSIKSILLDGINLYKLHTDKHGSSDSTEGLYACHWAIWEKQLRETLFANAEYLRSVQVSFEIAAAQVLEQLKSVAKGEYEAPINEKRISEVVVYAAVNLPVTEIHGLLDNVRVDITALLYSDKLAAFEARLSYEGERISTRNQWPHITLWTGEGIGAKEANTLPQILLLGKATQIEIDRPTSITGVVKFY